MHQIKRIIEFHLHGHSIRQIGRLCGISRNSIRDYLRRLEQTGQPLNELLKQEDQALLKTVQTDPTERNLGGRLLQPRYEVIEQKLEYYRSELNRRGVTRQLLWQEYRSDHPDGYGYTQFCEHLGRHLKRDQAVMHFTHRPGEQMQADFAGDKLGYVDRSTGELILCEILVCTMRFSHYMYVEALRSQQQEEWTKGLGNAFEFLGGVPQSSKFDNTRTAVRRANRYEPTFTEAMDMLAAHYGTTILAARVRKPRDKASVEKGVCVAYNQIYGPLRDRVFYSLEELNAAIRELLEMVNSKPFQAKAGSRKELFETQEKPLLKELPSTPFLIRHVTEGKVQRNYHVILGEDRHQYSVPYALIGKRLKIIYTTETVEIYDGLSRVAVHKRNYKKNGYSTLSEHMPERHRHYQRQKGWNAEDFEQQASRVGNSTLKVIQRILQSRHFYEQTYNSCLGILRLGNQYGHPRLEAACLRIQDAPMVSYGMVANILKRNLDKTSSVPQLFTPPHEQIRGPQSYQ
jgi:transposase